MVVIVPDPHLSGIRISPSLVTGNGRDRRLGVRSRCGERRDDVAWRYLPISDGVRKFLRRTDGMKDFSKKSSQIGKESAARTTQTTQRVAQKLSPQRKQLFSR